MRRKYADYEYRIGASTLRVSPVVGGWMWRLFDTSGVSISSNEIGEHYDLKRDALRAGRSQVTS